LPLSNSFLHCCFSLYRIVVERLPSKVSTFRRSASLGPCQLSHDQLRRDYFSAQSNKDECYIAAEFLSIERDQLFTVGDNKTYGGFYNAPLKPGETYRVWFGVFVTVDGVSVHREYLIHISL